MNPALRKGRKHYFRVSQQSARGSHLEGELEHSAAVPTERQSNRFKARAYILGLASSAGLSIQLRPCLWI